MERLTVREKGDVLKGIWQNFEDFLKAMKMKVQFPTVWYASSISDLVENKGIEEEHYVAMDTLFVQSVSSGKRMDVVLLDNFKVPLNAYCTQADSGVAYDKNRTALREGNRVMIMGVFGSGNSQALHHAATTDRPYLFKHYVRHKLKEPNRLYSHAEEGKFNILFATRVDDRGERNPSPLELLAL